MLQLFFGSGSHYKKELLGRLNIPFESISPNIDESPIPNESPEATSQRLSEEKALAVFDLSKTTSSVIIGADQAAECMGELVRKPITHAQAVRGLSQYSKKTLTFFTSASVICPEHNYKKTVTETISVKFRKLSLEEIESYLNIDQPYDCAGAFKCEGLGISLFESIESNDPFALIGLPLIGISHCLRELGFELYHSNF